MSKLDEVGENSNRFKRKPESDDEDDEIKQLTNQNKRILLDANEANSGSAGDEAVNKKRVLLEAMKKIEKIKREMSKLNNSQEDEEEFSSDENEEYNHVSDQDDCSSDEELFQSNLLMSAEALGFAMCAQETFKFLESHGIPPNDPVYIDLKQRLIGPTKK